MYCVNPLCMAYRGKAPVSDSATTQLQPSLTSKLSIITLWSTLHIFTRCVMILHFQNERLGWKWAVAQWVPVADWSISPNHFIQIYFQILVLSCHQWIPVMCYRCVAVQNIIGHGILICPCWNFLVFNTTPFKKVTQHDRSIICLSSYMFFVMLDITGKPVIYLSIIICYMHMIVLLGRV